MGAKDITELWWGLYQEHTVQGRHHETLRSSTAALVVTLAGAIITLISLNKSLDLSDWPWGVFLCILGLFGGVFSLKQYERFKYHMAIARAYRDRLDDGVGQGSLSQSAKNGRGHHYSSKVYKTIGLLRLYILWSALYAIITTLGIIVTFASLSSKN